MDKIATHNYQLTNSTNLEFGFQCRLKHSLSEQDLSPHMFSWCDEERDIICKGRSCFLIEGVKANAPFTDDNLDRSALGRYNKSSIKNACKYLRIPKTDEDNLLKMHTREKRRLYTGCFRKKQSSIIERLDLDITRLMEVKRELIREKKFLTQQINQFIILLTN